MTVFYGGEHKTMQALRDFLNAHQGRQLEFVCNDKNERAYAYTDWSDVRDKITDESHGKIVVMDALRRCFSYDAVSDAFHYVGDALTSAGCSDDVIVNIALTPVSPEPQ